MKTSITNLFLLPALIAGFGLIPAGRLTAQTFTTLHSFTATPSYPYPSINSDGANPYAGLVLSGNTLYGTAYSGGSSGKGTVFAVHTDGTGFTNLHSFTYYGSDGGNPEGGLILSGNTLYGTASGGGSAFNGTVVAVNTDGTGFTNLYSFTAVSAYPYTNSDGATPYAGLILLGNALYGTAFGGGSLGQGTVFKGSTNGTDFTNLHSFIFSVDGANPVAGLILSGNTLYGTANGGGGSGYGTVFKLNPDGMGFTNLHSLIYSDGANPYAGLILSGNTLYGTANGGGGSGNGTVFKVNTDGTSFTKLHSFTAVSFSSATNGDGANPYGGLVLSGNTLYGTALYGGSSGKGTVFAVHTNGLGFTTLYSFTGGSDGANPSAGLILSDNTLYGTARIGGTNGSGTVFSLSLGSVSAPQLTIFPSGTNVILTWPANAAGFTLQTTTNLVSPAVWSTVSPAPVVVNAQNVVTNSISGTKKFYRLSQ